MAPLPRPRPCVRTEARGGCRDFSGPFPLSLSMSCPQARERVSACAHRDPRHSRHASRIMDTGDSGAGERGVRVQLAEQVEHAVGPVDDDVGEVGQGALLLRGRADQQRRAALGRAARRPPRTPRRRRGRRRRTGSRRASSSSTRLRTATPLCIPWATDLDHVAARLDVQVVALGERRAAAASSRSNAALGVVEPTGVDGDREALLLDARLRRRRPGGAAAAARAGRRPARAAARGEITRRCGGGPALVAVLPEHEQLAAGLADLRCRPRRARRGPAPGAPGAR